MGDVLGVALGGGGPGDGVVEATGVVAGGAGGVHVHHTHVPQRLAGRPVGEKLQQGTADSRTTGVTDSTPLDHI